MSVYRDKKRKKKRRGIDGRKVQLDDNERATPRFQVLIDKRDRALDHSIIPRIAFRSERASRCAIRASQVHFISGYEQIGLVSRGRVMKRIAIYAYVIATPRRTIITA